VNAPRAVLFDFNGVLLEDETDHWRAFREVLAPLGVRLGRARYNARYLVSDDRTALRTMLRDAGLVAAPLERLLARKRRTYARLACGARIAPRAARLVRALARRVPVGVVSGATRREVAKALRRARLAGAFDVVVTAEDVGRPKPRPDGYRLALRRLGLKDGRGSVAIEDSPGGVRAARVAGCAVIGVATTFGPKTLRRAGAFRVVRRLTVLRTEQILPATDS
jgi:HAD superfamily hydrolase (TIGR01509 family)